MTVELPTGAGPARPKEARSVGATPWSLSQIERCRVGNRPIVGRRSNDAASAVVTEAWGLLDRWLVAFMAQLFLQERDAVQAALDPRSRVSRM
jgi:hypothetical protein